MSLSIHSSLQSSWLSLYKTDGFRQLHLFLWTKTFGYSLEGPKFVEVVILAGFLCCHWQSYLVHATNSIFLRAQKQILFRGLLFLKTLLVSSKTKLPLSSNKTTYHRLIGLIHQVLILRLLFNTLAIEKYLLGRGTYSRHSLMAVTVTHIDLNLNLSLSNTY